MSHAPQRKAPGGPAVLDVASGGGMDGAGLCLGLLLFLFRPPSTVSYPRGPPAPCPAPTRSPTGPSGAQAPPATCVHIPLPGVTTSRPRWVLSPPLTSSSFSLPSGSYSFCPLIITNDQSEKEPSVVTFFLPKTDSLTSSFPLSLSLPFFLALPLTFPPQQ